MAVEVSALRNRKGTGRCSDGGPQELREGAGVQPW